MDASYNEMVGLINGEAIDKAKGFLAKRLAVV